MPDSEVPARVLPIRVTGMTNEQEREISEVPYKVRVWELYGFSHKLVRWFHDRRILISR